MSTSGIAAAASVASLAIAQTAVAEPPQRAGRFTVEPVILTIDVRGLDLSSPAGAERLHRQIVATAKSACGGSVKYYKGVARGRHEREHVQRCFDEAAGDALAQLAAASGRSLEPVALLDRSNAADLGVSR